MSMQPPFKSGQVFVTKWPIIHIKSDTVFWKEATTNASHIDLVAAHPEESVSQVTYYIWPLLHVLYTFNSHISFSSDLFVSLF